MLVAYRDYMRLRIPRLATNLAPARPLGSTKLTLAAATELIALAEQCEGLCHTDPPGLPVVATMALAFRRR